MSGGRLIRPPFIDPATGIAYDTSNSEFEGYLTKQSLWLRVGFIVSVVQPVDELRGRAIPLFRCSRFWYPVEAKLLYLFLADWFFSTWLTQDWRRRFFILKGSRLFFAKTPNESPHGMIDLSRCTTVKSADLKSHKKHSFEISTPETTYLLYAGGFDSVQILFRLSIVSQIVCDSVSPCRRWRKNEGWLDWISWQSYCSVLKYLCLERKAG